MQRAMPAMLTLLLAACAPKVEVAVPAAPAVALDASRVAVVAGHRDCRELANALVDELNRMPGLTVDPAAQVRLEVRHCDRMVTPVVDVELGEQIDRRRVSVEGRAHALLAVTARGEQQAHLIGSSQRDVGASAARDVPTIRRAVERELVSGVALDLAEQLRPVPRLVERRLYPFERQGSARQLHNLAVRAESQGDYAEARRLAAASYAGRPTARTAAYLQELDRLLQRMPSDKASLTERP